MTRMRSRLVTASLAVVLLLVHGPGRAAFAARSEPDPTEPPAAPSPAHSGEAPAAADPSASPSPGMARPTPGLDTSAAADPGSGAAPSAAKPQPTTPASQAATDSSSQTPPDATAAIPFREGFHLGPADGEALARAYRRTGAAASVEHATGSLFPFGHVRPVLRCAPLRACAIELEPGELVLATSLGDSERWLLQSASSGPGARTPILVVKPTACDLSTNLVVSTDRRIYEIALDSPPCKNADSGEATYNPRLQYTGVARFYYPDDLVRRWSDEEQAAREGAERLAQGTTPLAPVARLAHLNFDYSWDRSRRWPWVPNQIFDDGEHTFIGLSPAARLAEMPLLFSLGPHGELAILNYHLEGQTLIADRVLERAVLVVGSAKKKDEQRLEILNRSFGQRR
jgi:P-type conjugative transfer protein TrbG